jgi:hypothetical protein
MKEGDYFENLDIDRGRILKRIVNKHDEIKEAAFIFLGLMTVDGLW